MVFSTWKTRRAINQRSRRLLLHALRTSISRVGGEEEKGERWEGGGAVKPAINEARPSL